MGTAPGRGFTPLAGRRASAAGSGRGSAPPRTPPRQRPKGLQTSTWRFARRSNERPNHFRAPSARFGAAGNPARHQVLGGPGHTTVWRGECGPERGAAPLRSDLRAKGATSKPAAATARLAITVTRCARYSALPWMSPFSPSGSCLIPPRHRATSWRQARLPYPPGGTRRGRRRSPPRAPRRPSCRRRRRP